MIKKEKHTFEKLRTLTENFKTNFFENLKLFENLIKSIKVLLNNKSSYKFI